jgi:hypothetical protein
MSSTEDTLIATTQQIYIGKRRGNRPQRALAFVYLYHIMLDIAIGQLGAQAVREPTAKTGPHKMPSDAMTLFTAVHRVF